MIRIASLTETPTKQPRRGESPTAGELWFDPGIGMRFRYIPKGEFQMGSPLDEEARDFSEKQHWVTIGHGFWMAETEVTHGQWRQLGYDLDSSVCADENCPVEKVSWLEAVEFANKLSEAAGLDQCYRVEGDRLTLGDSECTGYRLPSEAEWEYACRASTVTRYHSGDSVADLGRAGWYGRNSDGKSHPVGEKEPNLLGLCDMHGNVWEWVEDDTHRSSKGAPDTDRRMLRGGAYDSLAKYCRSAFRYDDDISSGYAGFGFRLCRSQGE